MRKKCRNSGQSLRDTLAVACPVTHYSTQQEKKLTISEDKGDLRYFNSYLLCPNIPVSVAETSLSTRKHVWYVLRVQEGKKTSEMHMQYTVSCVRWPWRKQSREACPSTEHSFLFSGANHPWMGRTWAGVSNLLCSELYHIKKRSVTLPGSLVITLQSLPLVAWISITLLDTAT